MPKSTITTKGYMGRDWTITGDLDGGLIIHKQGQTWTLTHVATGQAIGADRRDPKKRLKAELVAIRSKLHALGADWTRPSVPEIAQSAAMDTRALWDAVRAIAY